MQPVWCIEVEKIHPSIKWFLVAPEYGKLSSIFDTEYFSLFYSIALKKSVLLSIKTKEVPEKTKKRKTSEQKLKYIIMKNYSKVQIATSTF